MSTLPSRTKKHEGKLGQRNVLHFPNERYLNMLVSMGLL